MRRWGSAFRWVGDRAPRGQGRLGRTSSRIGDSLPTALTAGGTTVQYRYSAEGQRTYKKGGTSSPEYYVLDGSATLAVVEGGSPQFWNALTPSGETIGRHLAGGGSSERLFHPVSSS